MTGLHSDMVIACADLVGRCGASGFDFGYLHDDVPIAEAGWYAYATFQGARITVEDQPSPGAAAYGLAVRLLSGAQCRCRKPVTLADGEGCRWRLAGAKWEPGCGAPPVRVSGQRGDHAAMVRAMNQPNRAARRAAKKGRRHG